MSRISHKKWNKAEETQLLQKISSNMGIKEIAKSHGRSINSIKDAIKRVIHPLSKTQCEVCITNMCTKCNTESQDNACKCGSNYCRACYSGFINIKEICQFCERSCDECYNFKLNSCEICKAWVCNKCGHESYNNVYCPQHWEDFGECPHCECSVCSVEAEMCSKCKRFCHCECLMECNICQSVCKECSSKIRCDTCSRITCNLCNGTNMSWYGTSRMDRFTSERVKFCSLCRYEYLKEKGFCECCLKDGCMKITHKCYSCNKLHFNEGICEACMKYCYGCKQLVQKDFIDICDSCKCSVCLICNEKMLHECIEYDVDYSITRHDRITCIISSMCEYHGDVIKVKVLTQQPSIYANILFCFAGVTR